MFILHTPLAIIIQVLILFYNLTKHNSNSVHTIINNYVSMHVHAKNSFSKGLNAKASSNSWKSKWIRLGTSLNNMKSIINSRDKFTYSCKNGRFLQKPCSNTNLLKFQLHESFESTVLIDMGLWFRMKQAFIQVWNM